MTETPKLKVPFAPVQGRFPVVEQDSVDEVVQCVFAVLATEIDQRQEEPEFGIEDQTFLQGGADLPALQAAVARWEPRAEMLLDEDWDDLLEKVRAQVGVR